MAWLAGIRISDENLLKSCKVAPVTKVQITNVYFGDVMTIENNRQVRVNIDATLVAMFRNASSILEISAYGYPMTQLSLLFFERAEVRQKDGAVSNICRRQNKFSYKKLRVFPKI